MANILRRALDIAFPAPAPVAAPASPSPVGMARTFTAFDAGKTGRRLRSMPTSTDAVNRQIRAYGRTVLARSRYLCANNPYAASAKETWVNALVGSGIVPSPLLLNETQRREIGIVWRDWTDESDADGLTDFYGQQRMIAGEMFEAGECFIRLRPRRVSDGLIVPLQLQILQAEMLDLAFNLSASGGKNRIECGIEFDAIGRRVAYHFWRSHPGNDIYAINQLPSMRVRVPAEEVLHIFKPIVAGQIRGVPHTISAITRLAILDQYEDAELERKRTAALFGGFVTREATTDEDHPLENVLDEGFTIPGLAGAVGLEPGAVVDLAPGEDIAFAEPADVGATYDPFIYRNLLGVASGFGVPYMDMTGDLRQTSYGSQRAGILSFRRRIEADQHHIMIFQTCRPIWKRWMNDAMLVGALESIARATFVAAPREFMRVKWIPPKWDWIDPLKDRMAERLAVRAGFKAVSDVIEAEGYDPEETFRRIQKERELMAELELSFDSDASVVSNAGVAHPSGSALDEETPEPGEGDGENVPEPGEPGEPVDEPEPPAPRRRQSA